MRDPAKQIQAGQDGVTDSTIGLEDWGRAFGDLSEFASAVQSVSGLTFDFDAVVNLNTNFLQASKDYLILNVKDVDGEDPNKLLFLTEDEALLYSRKPPHAEMFRPFAGLLAEKFGPSTVLTFAILDQVTDNFNGWLEQLINGTRDLEQSFDYAKYRDLSRRLERLDDMLEEMQELLLKLEERSVKQVNAQAIAVDYNILKAEVDSLHGRCGRRLTLNRELAREHDTQATKDLNLRIERLSEIMKRLTALTVILMVPTLVVGHYGMNFAFMPELRVTWAYPAVILFQILAVVIGIITFKKIGWL